MATQRPENLQPVCEVKGCKEGVQILSLRGTIATWLKTCRRHTYKDLVAEQEKLNKLNNK